MRMNKERERKMDKGEWELNGLKERERKRTKQRLPGNIAKGGISVPLGA